jgi:CRP-like cAMP-binding protein
MAAQEKPNADQQVAFLRRVPLLRHFDDRLLGVLAGIMTLQRLAAGALLCTQGEPGTACFIIGNGTVEVLAGEGKGGQVLCTLGPGHVVGEVALIDGGKRSATVRCREDVVVFVLQREDFDRLLSAGNHASIRLLDNIARALAQRVRVVNQRYADIFSNTGETLAKLSERLRALQASVETGNAMAIEDEDPIAEDEQADLLKLVGYTDRAVPRGG